VHITGRGGGRVIRIGVDQVLRLVGRGQPNTAVASSLFIAETTVKTHVAHILTKLGLADRAQAVVLAYETGLVQPGESNNPLS
jgi:DNA-binding CsgD family transcriptional regulator